MGAETSTMRGREEKHESGSWVGVTKPVQRKHYSDHKLADFYFGPTRPINPDKGDVPILDMGRRTGEVTGIERMASSQRLLDCLTLYLLNRELDVYADLNYVKAVLKQLQGLGKRGVQVLMRALPLEKRY